MKLYNTLTRSVQELTPLQTGKIKLYTCGLTVYSQPHIGNWLPYIYWDVLVRTLRQSGYEVEHTQNITDVGHLTSDDDNGEDKMEKGARAEGITAWDVAAKYIDIASDEAEQLGLMKPTHLVRATDTIQQQIAFAKELADGNFLYEIPEDGMYFDTGAFNVFAASKRLQTYGEMARIDIDGLDAGARVSVAGKRNITDFAVWKFSPSGVQRDMEWDSPWGIGFPGWHLECSVIARETLGDQIDIHTGGIDHVPVHHINEIAQTEAVTGKQFSQFWMHNNHLKVDGGKMAKSKGNVYTLQDVLSRGFSLDAFKLFALGKHYRTEGNFTWENLEAAQNRLNHWREHTALVHQPNRGGTNPVSTLDFDAAASDMLIALQKDLDTPSVLTSIDETLQRYSTSEPTAESDQSMIHWLGFVGDALGISLAVADITSNQKDMIADRQAARAANDWGKSDELRSQLAKEGVGLRDTPCGALWYWL